VSNVAFTAIGLNSLINEVGLSDGIAAVLKIVSQEEAASALYTCQASNVLVKIPEEMS